MRTKARPCTECDDNSHGIFVSITGPRDYPTVTYERCWKCGNLYYLGGAIWTASIVFPLTYPLAIAIGFVCGDWRYGRLRDLA